MIRHSRCKEAGIPEYTLRQLQYFVAAAEAGTVTQAAEAVRLAELAEEPMVLLDLPHSRDYFQRRPSRSGTTPPRFRLCCSPRSTPARRAVRKRSPSSAASASVS
jgi:hypothetical protein